MGKDPAMLFYTSDFLTGVALMSMEERGQYITLLCLQQQRGHMTLDEMHKVVGDMSEELMSKFVEDEEGKFYNRRADTEIAKRAAHCQKQKEKVEKRWKNRSNTEENTTEDAAVYTTEDAAVIPYGKVLPLENGNRNNISLSRDKAISNDKVPSIEGNKVVKDRGYGGKETKVEILSFDTFWAAYPKKKAKSDAQKAFAKLTDDDKVKIMPALERQKKSYDWTKDGGQYVPYPATWLNGHRWEDEVTEAPARGKAALDFDASKEIAFKWLRETEGIDEIT